MNARQTRWENTNADAVFEVEAVLDYRIARRQTRVPRAQHEALTSLCGGKATRHSTMYGCHRVSWTVALTGLLTISFSMRRRHSAISSLSIPASVSPEAHSFVTKGATVSERPATAACCHVAATAATY